MCSALRLVTSSNLISNAEKMVLAENQRLTAEEKKRRILSFGPTTTVILGVPANVTNNSVPLPTADLIPAILSGDIGQSPSSAEASAEMLGAGHGLGCLSRSGHLFIRHAGQNFTEKFFDLANKYEILNSDGLVVLYAGETLEKFGAGKRDMSSILFDVTVLGLDGTPVLNIMSQKGVTTVTDFKKVLGTCIDVSTIFSPHAGYSIRDWNMCELFRLKKSNNGPSGDFDIITEDLSRIGLFTNSWNATLPNYIGIDKLYGISFPVDMVAEEKTILFGPLFTLFFHQLHEGGKGGGSGRKFWLIGIGVFIGVLVIGGLMLILWKFLK